MKGTQDDRSRGRSAAALRVLPGSAAMTALTAGLFLCMSPAAEAYVGPGAGMGVLGVMLAVVAALFMALVGMVLWPIRMVAHRRKLKAQAAEEGQRANAEMRRQDARRKP